MARRRRQPKITNGRVSYALSGDALDMELSSAARLAPANDEVYVPQPNSRIPKEGAWVLILRQLPPMEGDMHEHVRVARVFYAEHLPNADDEGFLPDGQYRVRLKTEWGTVDLWPYEYSMVNPLDIIAMWSDKEMTFHPTNMEPGRLNDIVFYCRARGITLPDALVMALGSLKGPVGWFEPRADLAEQAEAMAAHVHRYPAFPPRTRRAV